MIHDVFKYLSERLNEHLKVIFDSPEDLVRVTSINQNLDESSDLSQNQIVMSLINIERETSMGIQVNRQFVDHKFYKKTNPPWHLNLVFILASVSNDKQYLQSLKLLSSALEYYQNQNVFILPLVHNNDVSLRITVEPMNANYQEVSNIWSVLGGKYYPSLVGKIRMVTIDSDQISSVEKSSDEVRTKVETIG